MSLLKPIGFLHALLLVAALPLAGCSPERPPQLNLFAGYAQVELDEQDGFEPFFDQSGGGRIALGIDAPLTTTDDNGSGPRLGGRFSASMYREDLGDRIVAGEPLLEIEEFADLAILVPQVTLSYRQLLGEPQRTAAFLEPGVGLGLAIGVLSFGSDLEFGDQVIGRDIDDTQSEVGYALNPFLRGGLAFDRLLVGLEGGYQWTGLEFDDSLGENPSEWYIGVFLALRLGD